MSAFFSCLTQSTIPCPLSKLKRRPDSLKATQQTLVPFCPGEAVLAWICFPSLPAMEQVLRNPSREFNPITMAQSRPTFFVDHHVG